MPRTWHDRHAVNKIEDDNEKKFYRSIVADKKPYFMRYIYPALSKEYNSYLKDVNDNARRKFQMTVEKMENIPKEELTEAQSDFMTYYRYRLPLGNSNCVMNKICYRFEEEFNGYLKRHNANVNFDYTIMKNVEEYKPEQKIAIKKLYNIYKERSQSYKIFADYERVDKIEATVEFQTMREEFIEQCSNVCPSSRTLCNIILDVCYNTSTSKKFAWDVCGEDIIHNLLENNVYKIEFPTIDSNGDICYCGNKYSLKEKEIKGDD